MKIERLNANHISKIVEIEREAMDAPWSENMLTSELENPSTTFLVGINDGEVIAYAAFRQTLDEGDILNVAVRADMRGKGFGKQIFSSLIEEAKNQNVNELTLEVRADNASAIGLYEAFGFKREGLRKKYYNNISDALIMRLDMGDLESRDRI